MNRARGRGIRTVAIAALSGLASLCLADPPTLDLDVRPIWTGTSITTGVCPLGVDLGNTGSDAKGIVRVTCEGFMMDYPVELPRGAKKRLIVYPEFGINGASQVDITLATDKGSTKMMFTPPSMIGPSNSIVVLVSDHPGDLQFLAIRGAPNKRNYEEPTVKDSYALPQTLPDRTIAYQGIGAVMLGDGAERLTDVEVNSLKAYVLLGGTLVFKGGASAPVLLDSRWKGVLPIQNLKTATLPASAILGGGAPEGNITIQSGQPAPNATAQRASGAVVTAEKAFGLGKAVFLAYDPFESPCNKWSGRKTAFLAAVRPFDFLTTTAYLNQFETEPPDRNYYYYNGMERAQDAGPFNIQLPPTQRVFGILAAYFIVVIPLNFLILRKMRKGEWAWVTSPLISLAFAAAFFGSARELYAAGLSTSTKGLMVAGDGVPESVFLGSTKLFFPQGGSYDLKLSGVERIGTKRRDDPMAWGGQRPMPEDDVNLSPVDTGEIHVSGLDVTNLSFRQLYYRQRLSGRAWLTVNPARNGKVLIKNVSPFPMLAARICADGGETPIGELSPGESKTVDFPSPAPASPTYNDLTSLKRLMKDRPGCVVIASVQNLQPGPQIGKNVEGQSQVSLAYFSPVSGGSR